MAGLQETGARHVVVDTALGDVATSIRDDGFFSAMNSLEVNSVAFAGGAIALVLCVVLLFWYRKAGQAGTRRVMSGFARSRRVKIRKVAKAERPTTDFRELRKSRRGNHRSDASREIYVRPPSPDPTVHPSSPDRTVRDPDPDR